MKLKKNKKLPFNKISLYIFGIVILILVIGIITSDYYLSPVNSKDDEIVNCMCEGEKHTSYNEIAFTFPLQEYQNLAGVAVWPIQILNILFSNKNTFSKLSFLFTSIFNKKELTDEMKENFYPLLELFSNTFNRKFKTFYYDQDILQMFPFENLIEYIQTLEITDPPTILLKFRLMFILLFIYFI